MSADNWAQCPVCKERLETKKEAQYQAAQEAYGKVPMEEWDALRAKAREPVDERALITFREDYEFYLNGMNVEVRYRGFCSVCESGVSFTDTRPIEVKQLS